ncbi:MAG TPA: hypothetical protein VFZ83_01040 [Acidimicrobiia bacterium]|nr:hypothetical protein [Acidimicrobiia bacterium]
MPDYDSILERLTAIEEELRDLALDVLTSAVRDPDSDDALAARTEEKRLLQARRAVAKAIGALGGRPDLDP